MPRSKPPIRRPGPLLKAVVLAQKAAIQERLAQGATLKVVFEADGFQKSMCYDHFRRLVRRFVAPRETAAAPSRSRGADRDRLPAPKAQQTPISTPTRGAQQVADPSTSPDFVKIKHPPGSRLGQPATTDEAPRKFIFNPRYTRPSEADKAQAQEE